MAPVVAAPALLTRMSKAPEAARDGGEGALHRFRIGHVAADRQHGRAEFGGQPLDLGQVAIEQAIAAPSAKKARAVAAPIAPAAPVIATTQRSSRLGGVLPSLACSRGQYSISKVSVSPIGAKRPTASASTG